MLTLQDCIGFSGLTPDQLEAVADHEHMDMIIAAEWAEVTLDQPEGEELVERMLAEEVAHCESRHLGDRVDRYQAGLEQFHKQHPHR